MNAYEKGKQDRLNGLGLEMYPYQWGSEDYSRWIEGWFYAERAIKNRVQL